MLNKDYNDILRALYEEKVDFLLVGAYAMAVHGYPRATMDIITSVDGLIFSEASENALISNIDGIPVRVLSKADLIINKRATGRTKDLADAEMLEESGLHRPNHGIR